MSQSELVEARGRRLRVRLNSVSRPCGSQGGTQVRMAAAPFLAEPSQRRSLLLLLCFSSSYNSPIFEEHGLGRCFIECL